MNTDWAVDVVIPVRNGARYVADCLDSVIAQTWQPKSIIVVDDGSTDETVAIVENYQKRLPSLQLLRTEKRGVSHARNAGIDTCRAPFIAFLDSDDTWTPRKLERQMQLFSVSPAQVGLIYCSYFHIDEHGRKVATSRLVEPKRRSHLLHDLLLEGNIVSGSNSAVVARRGLLAQVGGFDRRLTYGEDWDLWLRLAEVTQFDFVPEALVALRLHGKSMQGSGVPKLQVDCLLQQLLILDRWYATAVFPQQLLEEYRRASLLIALETKGAPLPRLRQRMELLRRIQSSPSRFGRELFSGLFDFFVAMEKLRLSLFYYRHLRDRVYGILGPRRYGTLKRLFRSDDQAARQ